MTADLRPLTASDVPAWARLLAAIEAEDHTGEHYSEEDLAEEIADPVLTIGKDVMGLYRGDDLVGYFMVRRRALSDGRHRIGLEGGVRPDVRHQGLGTVLAAAMRERGMAAHREVRPDLPVVFTALGLSRLEDQAAVLAGIGLRPERYMFQMGVDFAGGDVLPVPALPDDLELRPYGDDVDAAMFAAHNEAFVDHRGFAPWTETMWRQWVSGSRNFRPQHSFVVVPRDDPERVVAYLQSNEFDAETEARGTREAYVAKLGTRREQRGRGLAGTLLRHALAHYREAGYDGASLDVDSENPTGALGIYTRAGFEVRARFTDYEAVVDPVS